MTIEELLKPRYKVIADYPFNPYPVGDVMDRNATMKNFLVAETGQYAHFIPISEMDKMPHLFKKLEWWEERKLEEMPEYLSCQSPDFRFKKGDLIKVDKWVESFGPTLRFYSCSTDKITLHPHLYLPATREEYEAYQKTKQ